MHKDDNPADERNTTDDRDGHSQQGGITDPLPPITEQKTTENGDEDAGKKPKTSLPVRILRVFVRPRRWRKRRDDHPPKTNWVEKSTLAVAILVFFVTVIQARIYYGQLERMDGSLNQNERAVILNMGQIAIANRNAKTAENSLQASSDSFHIDHRPYVFVGTNRQDRLPIEWERMSLFPAVDVSFKNFGHSPAVAFKIGCQVASGKNALNQVRYVPTEKKIGEAFIAPGDAMLHSCASTDKISTEGEARVVYGTNYFLVVFGHVEYSDLWNAQPPYVTEFCYVRYGVLLRGVLLRTTR